ncbi:MAG: cohesin domain-containing protein [Minisyncoccia bacterium]
MQRTKSFSYLYKKIFIRTLSLVFLFFGFSNTFVFAAKLDIVPTFGSVTVGDNIKVRVVLSSTDQSANAISGVVSFSKDLLTLNSISKSDSLVSLWPVEPTYSNSNGTANFEGVVLNGYKGGNGTVLTLFFKAKSAGVATIKFNDASVLANDGQGTQILGVTGESRFNISDLKEKPTQTVNDAPVLPIVENTTPSLQIEEIKKKDELDPRSRFLITSINTKPGALYQIVLDNNPYVWNDSGSHIFETVPLTRGIHSIKVSIDTLDGNVLSKSISFSNTGIATPVFTDYSNDVVENEYIVVKGTADPSTFVIITSDAILENGVSGVHESVTVKSNEKGLFTYVSENRAKKGIYMISASSRSVGGIESETTTPIKISVSEGIKPVAGRIMDTLSLVIPIAGLLALLIAITVYGWYKILHFKTRMRKRLSVTKTLVDKSFDILQEDIDEEVKIFKKVRDRKPLTEDERSFVNQFKKDISAAERTIVDDIKNSGV